MSIEEFREIIRRIFYKHLNYMPENFKGADEIYMKATEEFIDKYKDAKSYEEFHDRMRTIPTDALEHVEPICLEKEEYMMVSYIKKELEYRSTLPKPKKDILNRRR